MGVVIPIERIWEKYGKDVKKTSVLINGMEMPKSCYICPFCDYVSARCDAVKGNPYTPESRYEKRADFCPLVPIPPHGRLIDADAFEKHIKKDWEGYDQWIAVEVENRPTVIEAEEEE